jgi:hypothetical protein
VHFWISQPPPHGRSSDLRFAFIGEGRSGPVLSHTWQELSSSFSLGLFSWPCQPGPGPVLLTPRGSESLLRQYSLASPTSESARHPPRWTLLRGGAWVHNRNKLSASYRSRLPCKLLRSHTAPPLFHIFGRFRLLHELHQFKETVVHQFLCPSRN